MRWTGRCSQFPDNVINKKKKKKKISSYSRLNDCVPLNKYWSMQYSIHSFDHYPPSPLPPSPPSSRDHEAHTGTHRTGTVLSQCSSGQGAGLAQYLLRVFFSALLLFCSLDASNAMLLIAINFFSFNHE
jgi:hypothetical protein